MPVGTPVIVNGVQIGLSGNGNGRYGAHLHVGRFAGGGDTNPQGGGFNLAGARVTSFLNDFSDPVNGKYIRVQDASGAVWVYLHLSEVTCSVGQVLGGGSPAPQTNAQGGDEMIANADQASKIYKMLRPNGGASQEEINGTAGHRSFAEFVNTAAPEIAARDAQITQWQTQAQVGQNASQQLAAMQTTVDTLHAQVDQLAQEKTTLGTQLNDATGLVATLQAQVDKFKNAPVVVAPDGAVSITPKSVSFITRLLEKFIKKS
jgi:hypothetical protein